MSKLDRCDVVVGSGETILTAGAYKAEGSEETSYKFGIKIDLPDFTDQLKADLLAIGAHRVMSVKAAGTFNKATDYGTQEEAEAFAKQFSTIEGWVEALTKQKREGGVKTDSDEGLAARMLAKVLKRKVEDGSAAEAKVEVPRLDDPPKTEKGVTNYIAWAKVLKEEKHPWFDQCLKKVKATEKGFE